MRTGEVSPARLRLVHQAAWSRHVTAWMLVSTLATWILAAAGFLFYLTGIRKSPVAIEGRPSLRESVHIWLRNDIRPDYDQLNLFLSSTLLPLYSFGSGESSFRPLLKGMVTPHILEEADDYLNRHAAKIHDGNLQQFLRLEFADPRQILFDADSRRMSVPFKGELSIVSDTGGTVNVVRVPVAGRAVLSPNVPSAVNPFPFYLEALDLQKEEESA